MIKTPEHDKLKEVQAHSQQIHEFIDWLQETYETSLAHYLPHSDAIVWQQKSLTTLVAEFYGINLIELENEKRAILDEIRKANNGNAR